MSAIPAGALDLTGEVFKPIMSLPENLPVFDFTQSYDPERMLDFPFGVTVMTKSDHRCIQRCTLQPRREIFIWGLTSRGPAGTEVYSFAPGTVHSMVDNDRPQDYGPTIITVHEFKGQTLYALYGHLSRSSLHHLSVGDVFCRCSDRLDWGEA